MFRITGADPRRLKERVREFTLKNGEELAREVVEKLVRSGGVVLFGKGDCEYSLEVKEVLEESGVEFKWVDVLGGGGEGEGKGGWEELRRVVKKRDLWESFPIVYAGGKVVGGVDVVRELKDKGDLKGELERLVEEEGERKEEGNVAKGDDGVGKRVQNGERTVKEEKNDLLPKELKAKLEKLIKMKKIMLFMKGNPSTPKCGFSKATVDLLKANNIGFGHFDILEDQDIRQGLKIYSNWPTFPQLYADGVLVGGCDIVKELAGSGELKSELGVEDSSGTKSDKKSQSPLEKRLEELINKNKIMLFMKGEKENPFCKFSKATVQVLNDSGIDFEPFDILQDPDVRQGLKDYSKWPTFPQLYANGKLVGGCDIVKELAESGELKEELGV